MTTLGISKGIAYFVVATSLAMVAQGAPTPVDPSGGETVHVLVGKSIVINVQTPLNRVLSSNPDAVETMATSPHRSKTWARTSSRTRQEKSTSMSG